MDPPSVCQPICSHTVPASSARLSSGKNCTVFRISAMVRRLRRSLQRQGGHCCAKRAFVARTQPQLRKGAVAAQETPSLRKGGHCCAKRAFVART